MIFYKKAMTLDKIVEDPELKAVVQLFKHSAFYEANEKLNTIEASALNESDLKVYKELKDALTIHPQKAISILVITLIIFASFIYLLSR